MGILYESVEFYYARDWNLEESCDWSWSRDIWLRRNYELRERYVVYKYGTVIDRLSLQITFIEIYILVNYI